MLTLAKLRQFAKRRNKSEFQSNLQFQIDADASGFKTTELGDPMPFRIDGFKGYQWKPSTDVGSVRVIEFGGRIYIGDNDDPDTRSMLELMNTAEFEVLQKD